MENDNLEENTDIEELVDTFDETEPIEPTEPEAPAPEVTETPELVELKKRLATAEAQKDHWKKKANVSKTKATDKATQDISSKDLYALMEDKVPQEDVDDVVRASKALGISIPEALKSNIVKTILSESADKRKTADVTNTGNTRTGPTQVSDDDLVTNASKGELPEDDESIARLIAAKLK